MALQCCISEVKPDKQHNSHPYKQQKLKATIIMARQNDEQPQSVVPSTMRVVFGIIMIIVYVGMGVLLLLNYFDWHNQLLTWLRWIGGILFIIYGIWRAIRQFWGLDTSL